MEDAFEAGSQQHTVPSTDCLELLERYLLVNRSCPQNKTLLRKHHHHRRQPRQHVCWRRRRGNAKSRHLYFNYQFSTVQGGRGQIFVVVLLPVSPVSDLPHFFSIHSILLSASERPRLMFAGKKNATKPQRATKSLQMSGHKEYWQLFI